MAGDMGLVLVLRRKAVGKTTGCEDCIVRQLVEAVANMKENEALSDGCGFESCTAQ